MLKNTGKYAELYVTVCALVRRPVDEETLKLIEERRATIAPCDNLGEIVSPVVIMIAIGFESLFDSLPIGRAKYFANNGVMEGWRNERFRGEAQLMLVIVFVVRITFCWIEVKVRARQRGNETDASTTTGTDLRLSSSSGEAVDSHSELPSSADEGVVTVELSIASHRTTPESTDGALATWWLWGSIVQSRRATMETMISPRKRLKTVPAVRQPVRKQGGHQWRCYILASLVLTTPPFICNTWRVHSSRCSRLSLWCLPRCSGGGNFDTEPRRKSACRSWSKQVHRSLWRCRVVCFN